MAEALGISLYAKQLVDGRDRKQLERLARYITRPPLALERLSQRADGRLELELKSVWKDGTRAILLEPHDLLVRLCASVPAPRLHLVPTRTGPTWPNCGTGATRAPTSCSARRPPWRAWRPICPAFVDRNARLDMPGVTDKPSTLLELGLMPLLDIHLHATMLGYASVGDFATVIAFAGIAWSCSSRASSSSTWPPPEP